ncbi:dTMP kinase [Pyrococcus kukulkanii]|uniref:Probable thymidylate kinase n=1 Tax=Pyrococcus kukulkanii TaxID=1609559 RepID=A0ABV4T958_9EURY
MVGASSRFIVLEGPDGAGKTTYVKLLAQKLRHAGFKVITAREPSDGPIGREIRRRLKTGDTDGIGEMFLQDREWHMNNVVLPALRKGYVVVMDRYWPSSIAYRRFNHTPPEKVYAQIRKYPEPRIIVLDAPVEVLLERVGRRSDGNFFDKREVIETVRQEYLMLAEKHGFPVVRTDRWPSEVFRDIVAHVEVLS